METETKKIYQSKNVLKLKLGLLLGLILFTLFILIFIMDDIELHTGLPFIDLLGSDIVVLSLGIATYFALHLYLTLQWKNLFYQVRHGEIVFNDGIIFKKRKVYALENLEGVTSYQDILGKWMNFGTIELHKRFESQNESLVYVENPKKVQDQIEEASEIRERVKQQTD